MSTSEKKKLGIYPKYDVRRKDATDVRGGKHEHCQLFVLDLTHDPHAAPAALAYADSCERVGYHELASDLRRIVGNTDGLLPVEEIERQLHGIRNEYAKLMDAYERA